MPVTGGIQYDAPTVRSQGRQRRRWFGAFEPRCAHCDRYYLRKAGHAERCPRRPRLERCTTCGRAWDDHLENCPAGLALAAARYRMELEAAGHRPGPLVGVPQE